MRGARPKEPSAPAVHRLPVPSPSHVKGLGDPLKPAWGSKQSEAATAQLTLPGAAAACRNPPKSEVVHSQRQVNEPLKMSPHKKKDGNEMFWTNRQNKGLISADRGTKATLTRTIPRSIFKSSTKDLSFPIFELVIRPRHAAPSNLRDRSTVVML